jgi:cold shock CspA family protein
MRRSSKGHGPRTTTQRQPTDTGTVKSIECQQGTGSIAPDRDAQVQADTGFTSDVVMDGDVTTLQVGDRVRFEAAPTPDRPGYADATTVQAAGGNIAGQAITRVSPSQSDATRGRPPGAGVSAAEQAVENQEAALASGEENPG